MLPSSFTYDNRTGRGPGRGVRAMRTVLPGAARVWGQVEPYADSWRTHNVETVRQPGRRWIVLGEGPERAALEARSTALDVEFVVNLAGFVAAPEAILREATVAVQPSLSEGLGSSVLDALALGVPIVATTAGGLPEALAHGGGVLVPPGSPAELAAAVGRLLDDAAERQRLGAAGRLAAGHFSVERLVQRTLDVYRSVAQTQGTR